MRYLNKIIFINSAHVPYAEIKLDGNVHFIGTQGVGKSTLLRAILFFYNVDKSKLGIRTQDKQKSYDEFYFPYPNSYIIYEVCRENGKFFVMTFASNGRVAFRIVDCAYEKRFFIEDDNNVRYEWGRISEQIGTKVFRSNIIRGYEEFRDIIYGNIQKVSKELRRFNLMESSKYHNLPRTIQNIFLNQSLESRVIKDTIINSMDFADDSIDLNFYREHVKDFRQQYDDIWKWYKKERNGKVKVQTDAENVITKYALYEVTKRTITELSAKLNFAFNRDTENLPKIEASLDTESNELNRQKRLLGEEHGKFTKERDALKGKIAVINDFLNRVKEKKQHFTEIGIDVILKKISQERELMIRKSSLVQQQQTLTDKNQDVKSKFDVLIQEVENSLKKYQLLAAQKVNDLESRKTTEINAIQSELNSRLNELNGIFQQKQDDLLAQIETASHEKNDLQLKENKIALFNPFQDEIEEQSNQIREQERKQFELISEINKKQQEIIRITHETETKRKDLEINCEMELTKISQARESLVQEVDKLAEMLSRQKGSFIEWLSNNASQWKDTIGKVVDDEVLYSTSLEPVKVDSSDTLYGIHLELRNIERTVHTPDEVRTQKANLEEKIHLLDNKVSERKKKLEQDIQELERLPKIKLKSLRFDKINLEADLGQIPSRIEQYSKKKKDLEEQLVVWRKQELASVRLLLQGKEAELSQLQHTRQEQIFLKQKEVDKIQKSFEKQKKEIVLTYSNDKDEVKANEKVQVELAVVHKRELEAEMDAELKGLGINVEKLSKIRNELLQVTDELTYIENHKKDYYEWITAKSEYFDLESARKNERKVIETKLDDLTQKFNLRKEKKEAEVQILTAKIANLQKELSALEEGIERVKTFRLNSTCPTGLENLGTKESQEKLSVLLDQLRDMIDKQQQRMEEFKKSVNVFKCNFSPQNTFHFRTEFNTETDYVDFASELNEFLSNKKIEEYRTRTSNQYAAIIKRIAREVGDLNKHNADIKSTINDINRDFRENNFAGVIKDIELRAVESSDRLMQQLLNIKKFDEEYGFDIGQLNLFSNEQNQDKTNQQAIKLLMGLIEMMDAEKKRETITLSDSFKLEFKVKENDNDTNWVEKLSNVGSDGTDILVKSMVNIMLINVFKRKITKRFGDFKLHCMMDEIGKLHPDNVEGILKFANVRNIYLINSSPTTYNAQVYKYTYSLSKDERSNTQVKTLLTIR